MIHLAALPECDREVGVAAMVLYDLLACPHPDPGPFALAEQVQAAFFAGLVAALAAPEWAAYHGLAALPTPACTTADDTLADAVRRVLAIIATLPPLDAEEES